MYSHTQSKKSALPVLFAEKVIPEKLSWIH